MTELYVSLLISFATQTVEYSVQSPRSLCTGLCKVALFTYIAISPHLAFQYCCHL